MEASVPLACQDWANTKAAYRFFSNDRIGQAEILAGTSSPRAIVLTRRPDPSLFLQDTTEFTYQRERANRVGMTYRVNSGKDKAGCFRMNTVCGLYRAVDCRALMFAITRRNLDNATLEIRYRRIRVLLPSIDKKKRYPTLNLTVIYVNSSGIDCISTGNSSRIYL